MPATRELLQVELRAWGNVREDNPGVATDFIANGGTVGTWIVTAQDLALADAGAIFLFEGGSNPRSRAQITLAIEPPLSITNESQFIGWIATKCIRVVRNGSAIFDMLVPTARLTGSSGRTTNGVFRPWYFLRIKDGSAVDLLEGDEVSILEAITAAVGDGFEVSLGTPTDQFTRIHAQRYFFAGTEITPANQADLSNFRTWLANYPDTLDFTWPFTSIFNNLFWNGWINDYAGAIGYRRFAQRFAVTAGQTVRLEWTNRRPVIRINGVIQAQAFETAQVNSSPSVNEAFQSIVPVI